MASNVELMVQHIYGQADMFDKYAADIYEKCLDFLNKNDAKKRIQKVYITGCGDSYYAGMCVKDFFIQKAKIHTEAWQALELSKYILPYEVDENSLVVSISASGSVARTAECAIRAGQKKALSLAITTNPNSRLAQVAPEVLYIELEKNLGLAPGTQSYCVSLLCLYCLATALAKIKGEISDDEVQEIFAEISKLCEAMKKTADVCSNKIKLYLDAYMTEEKGIKMFHVLGSGPNVGTAQFAVMKLLEAAGFDSLAVGIEEWAHSQYFTTCSTTHTVVLAPIGQSHQRALEILPAITVKDGKKIVIGQENDDELKANADIYFPIVGMDNINELFSPLIYAVPLELLAMHISAKLNRSGFEFETKPWIKEANFRQIFGSKIDELEEK